MTRMAGSNRTVNDTQRLVRWALITSLGLLTLRLGLAEKLGFGDAEALYAAYALHPQPVYLDHPGLIGHVARFIGRGGAPSPAAAHMFTALGATLVPWLGCLAARAAGASWAGALRTLLALALVPELAIGLYALTPALPLAAAWLGALALAARAVAADPKSLLALGLTLGAGVLVGVAFMAHVSGALLGLGLVAASLSRPLRARWRTFAPWGAVIVSAILAVPVVAWEARRGWPMLTHRFFTTQFDAGVSLRNLAALLGGQLLYVTPAFLLGAWIALRGLNRRRDADPLSALLFWTCALPGAALALLCAWSRVAEPHWLGPAYLGLAIEYGRSGGASRRLSLTAALSGAAIALLAWFVVATPVVARIAGRALPPRYDITNDLYAWKDAAPLLERALSEAASASGRSPVVVGPHWIVCAQLAAVLGAGAPVGCNGPQRDDFDDWLPRSRWIGAPVIVFVTDSRFDLDPKTVFAHRRVDGAFRLDVRRDGRVVRTLRVVILRKSSELARLPSPSPRGGPNLDQRIRPTAPRR
jgi:hypothetical protein